MKKKKHVFVSYCHENFKQVKALVGDLSRENESVWWDENIPKGSDWNLEIKRALADAYAAIVCFSCESEKKYQSGIYPELYVLIEQYRKLAPGTIFILPVRLSSCSIPDIPIHSNLDLNGIQRTDLFPSRCRHKNLRLLIESCRSIPTHP